MKKLLASLLSVVILLSSFPLPVGAAGDGGATVTVQNEYIRLVVSTENGGYTIATIEGDILKKTDDNRALTHRGANFDTSFTSFQIDGETGREYIFGNDYGFLGLGSTPVSTVTDSVGVTSTWQVGALEVEQRIELVSGLQSEQLGTALITYTVRNKSAAAMDVRSRVLVDTQLGDQDYGHYEVARGALGAGYDLIASEKTLDSNDGDYVPADYFVKDDPFNPQVAAFGVNGVIDGEKPYKMTFAHWANIAATKFDYTPNEELYFSTPINDLRTADSAAALYYDLSTIAAGAEKSFSTWYGVTANLKNAENQVALNTTAPTRLTYNADRTAFIGSSGRPDNLIRISTTIQNPAIRDKDYHSLRVVVYAVGFTTQRQTDSGEWIFYDNVVPVYTDVINFLSGQNRTTYFDFKFEPRDNHELGSFVTKVYNMDPAVNELQAYAEKFCLGTTTNYIYIPAKDPSLPSITLRGMEPKILYNDDRRFLTVSGTGMSFFQTGLTGIELRGETRTYPVPIENMTIAQDTKSLSLLLTEYMEPGRYELFFLWDGSQPQDVPAVLTAPALSVQMSSDERYRNDKYGVITVMRDGNKKYKIVAYSDEAAFAYAGAQDRYAPEDMLFALRGELVKDKTEDVYRITSQDANVTINHILNYRGSDFTVRQSGGTVEILMNGKITTIGANTTVRDGSAAFYLRSGTNYVVPEYTSRGEIVSGDDLRADEAYLELAWNSPMDVLQTIGGFLIDLKFGVLGKIQDVDDPQETYDIISFGGGLDLSFMTPGGAKTARENKSKQASWDVATLDDRSGLNPIGQPEEREGAPTTKQVTKLAVGASVHDVLYGRSSSDTGYLGINMEADITLPQIVSFLPSKLSGNLAINTIGGYQVGVSGEGKATMFELSFSLVIKSNPSGAPIPDKLFFAIGGFEPGINIDGHAILWVTGGGGGFDNLYETIYGTDGLPPFKLLLNVQLDIFKILTGTVDLGLSLRSINVALSDVSLKMIKNAKFLDRGEVNLTWYPNFDLNASANVNFFQVFKGAFSLVANEELLELMLRVAIGIPNVVPIVGGMTIASAELGGGTEKMWGSVEILELIRLGFVYYWDSGGVEFTSGRSAGDAKGVYSAMVAPQAVSSDQETGATQYVAVGGNLAYVAGSTPDQALTPERLAELKAAKSSGRHQQSAPTATEVVTNQEQTAHVVTFGAPSGDYILTVSRADGAALGPGFKGSLSVWNNGEAYALNYYEAPDLMVGEGHTLTAAQKAEAKAKAAGSNVNIVGSVAYIAVPSAKQTNPVFLVEFSDGSAYNVGAVFVEPISELSSPSAVVLGNGQLQVAWSGQDLSDTAKIIVSIADEPDAPGMVLASDIAATALTATLDIPDTVASGTYHVTLTLSDEEICYSSYPVPGSVAITNAQAPSAPTSVKLQNAGNNKLSVIITDDFSKAKLEGYFVDVYEDDSLIEAGLYYDKEQAKNDEILIGGIYQMPLLEEYTDDNGVTQQRQQTDASGQGIFRTVGFTPGKNYQVKVRAGNTVALPDGTEVFHCSGSVRSSSVPLTAATPPNITITASGAVPAGQEGVGFALSGATNTYRITASEAVRGTLAVNGASGETYDRNEFKLTHDIQLTLPDGVHSLEFAAVDEQGDRAIYQTSVSIDTTPPVLMLSQPLNGSIFQEGILSIVGIAEPEATYTFRADGLQLGVAERDLSGYFSDGLLQYQLDLGPGAMQREVEIAARDAVGNVTTETFTIVDGRLADIVAVQLQVNGAPLPAIGYIQLDDSGETLVPSHASLKLLGQLAGGGMLDITKLEGVSFRVAGGSGVRLERNTVSLLGGAANALVVGEYRMGADAQATLTDGVVVSTAALPQAPDFTALDLAIAEGRVIPRGNHSSESWNNLQQALANGEALRGTLYVDQQAVDIAQQAIVQVIAELTTGSYSVTFNANGGSPVAAQTVLYGNRATEPIPAPTRSGYTFGGWYSNSGLTNRFLFTTPITADIGLYARWNAVVAEQEPEGEEPERTIISGQVRTPDDHRLQAELRRSGRPLIDVRQDQVTHSVGVLRALAHAGQALLVNGDGIKLEFPPGWLQVEAEASDLVEIVVRRLSDEEQAEQLATAHLADTFQSCGQLYQLTATLIRGDVRTPIELFGLPVLVSIDLSQVEALTTEQIEQLTAVRLEADASGALLPVTLGGSYDRLTETFTFKTEQFSLYGIMLHESVPQTRITLTVGSRVITVNGQERLIDVAPVIVSGRTLVPIRFIADGLGFGVDWNGESRTVVITEAEQRIQLVIGQVDPAVGLDVPAQIMDSRTMVPLRYIGEAFSAEVNWDQSSRTVEVNR